MKQFSGILLVLLLGTSVMFISCDENGGMENPPVKTGVLVVNEGNFGAGNGSISFYDEDSMQIVNNVIRNANNGAEIGSLVQSIYAHDGVAYTLCNDANKIEFFDVETFAFLGNPLLDISVPRYMAASGELGYITCWGPWVNWALPDSYIAVIDLNRNQVVDSLESGSGPEGIVVARNKIYVANSAETSITIVDLSDNSVSKIDVGASPKHFALDASGNLWVTLVSSFGVYPAENVGLLEVLTNSDQLGTFVRVTNLSENGNIAVNGGGTTIYTLTVEPWEPNIVNSGSEVRKFDVSSKILEADPLVTGEDFYGLGYNTSTDLIYVSDSRAFTGPGKLFIYNSDGRKIDEQTTSIGPNGFLFN